MAKKKGSKRSKTNGFMSKQGQRNQDKDKVCVERTEFVKGLSASEVIRDPDMGYIYKVIEPKLEPEEREALNTILSLFKQTIFLEAPSDKMGMEAEPILMATINGIIDRYDIDVSGDTQDKVMYYIRRDILGYGLIDNLMQDENIEDISCNGAGSPIFVYHRIYENIPTNVSFSNNNELDSFIVLLAQKANKHISLSQPLVDGRLPDGSRLQCTLSEVTPKGSTFTIRRFREVPLTPVDLIKNGTISYEMAAYFWMAVEFGSSVSFSGGTATGKTTTLNALSLFIPINKKIVSVEDTREINIPHKNWIAGVTKMGFLEGASQGPEVDMFDLVKAALRQRPQILIVGEVRGKETFIMFQAMAVGHTAYTTIHADNFDALIQRLEAPPISLPRVLVSLMDIVVFQKQIRIGERFVRKVTEVIEVSEFDQNTQNFKIDIPFQYDEAHNKFVFSGKSAILQAIKRKMAWDDDDLLGEFARRVQILKGLVEQDTKRHTDFIMMVESYYRKPQATYAALVTGKGKIIGGGL